MNELQETLERGLMAPIELSFPNIEDARSWVYRAHNYIRRHWPAGRQLMISRRGSTVRIMVPQMTIREL